MNKLLLPLATCFILTACGGQIAEPQTEQKITASEVSAPEQTASGEVAANTLKLSYQDYRAAANKRLKEAKTGLEIPADSAPPTPKRFHDFSDGLSVQMAANDADQLTEIRVVWNSDANPQRAEQLLSATAALIAATAPEDRTLLRDAADQIKMAIQSHNGGGDPTRKFARGGIAYKVTVTNIPSVVFTAQPQ